MSQSPEEIFLSLLDKERNIYEPAQLFQQNRRKPDEFLGLLATPGSAGNEKLTNEHSYLVAEKSGKKFPVKDNVVDFTREGSISHEDQEWEKLNKQFLNYHKSLSVYTMVNSMPIANYLACKSGMATLQNKTIVDVGGGTGQVLGSFFHFPETLHYILLDPNLRLLHDQFLRMYPKLASLKMSHILSYAEELPFKSQSVDVVMSLSAIDHFKDYKAFFKEAARIVKPGGIVFVSSHLDLPVSSEDATRTENKLFSFSFFERLARYLYYRKHKVGNDDHTFHFTGLEPFINAANEAGLSIKQSEIFKRYFFIVAERKN